MVIKIINRLFLFLLGLNTCCTATTPDENHQVSHALRLAARSPDIQSIATLMHYLVDEVEASDFLDVQPKLTNEELFARDHHKTLYRELSHHTISRLLRLEEWRSSAEQLNQSHYQIRPQFESNTLSKNWVRVYYAENRLQQREDSLHFNINRALHDPQQKEWMLTPTTETSCKRNHAGFLSLFHDDMHDAADCFFIRLTLSKDFNTPHLREGLIHHMNLFIEHFPLLDDITKAYIQDEIKSYHTQCPDMAVAVFNQAIIKMMANLSTQSDLSLISIGLNIWKTNLIIEAIRPFITEDSEVVETLVSTLIKMKGFFGIYTTFHTMNHRDVSRSIATKDIAQSFFRSFNLDQFLFFMQNWDEWSAYVFRTHPDATGFDLTTPTGLSEFKTLASDIIIQKLMETGMITTSTEYPLLRV